MKTESHVHAVKLMARSICVQLSSKKYQINPSTMVHEIISMQPGMYVLRLELKLMTVNDAANAFEMC